MNHRRLIRNRPTLFVRIVFFYCMKPFRHLSTAAPSNGGWVNTVDNYERRQTTNARFLTRRRTISHHSSSVWGDWRNMSLSESETTSEHEKTMGGMENERPISCGRSMESRLNHSQSRHDGAKHRATDYANEPTIKASATTRSHLNTFGPLWISCPHLTQAGLANSAHHQ